mgnify:CR=1 FL=1
MMSMIRKFFSSLFCSLALFTAGAAAQDQAGSAADKDKLVVTADDTLEWHRDKKRFYARGAAVAERGTSSIHGDTLIAHYNDNGDGDMRITKLIAEESVRIISDDSTAHGVRAVYDVNERRAVMTGNNLRLVMPDQTVFAEERFIYNVAAGQFTARGNARVEREDTKLRADELVAELVPID